MNYYMTASMLKGISLMTEEDYEVGGTTALLDAIGFSIQKIKNVQKRTSESNEQKKCYL